MEVIANRYAVKESLGEGAMGSVWRVCDTTTEQDVALKVISQKYAGASGDKSVLQFKQEFRLMTQLRHPNCCAVYDYGALGDGSPYFTMEIVPGQGLNELTPIPLAQFKPIMSQLLLALGYIHQLGFVHLDVKSENVRLRPDGSLKLMDYGLMEYARRPSGFINGTLAYISPEVIRRGAIDQRTDLYSVGVLAYEMVTGRVPFDSPNPRDVLQAHISEPPQPPSDLREDLDEDFEAIIMKLLAKNPLDRFQSAFQVLEAMGVEVPAGIGGNLLTSPLMGREDEMEVLAERLAALERGAAGGALLITGPSGIGKSRLLEEFRFTVQLANMPCAVGFNFEQGNMPYQPIVTILKHLLPAFKDHVPGMLAVHGPVLVKLLPEIGALDATAMDSPTKDKLRLQATITEMFSALAAKRPFALVIEDWQWADALSIELLDYVTRNSQGTPLLIVQTSRVVPTTIPEGVTVMPLGQLDSAGVQHMVTSMLGTSDISSRFMAEVIGLSKGSPFFVEKLMEHLVQNQILDNQRGIWNTDIQLATIRLPKSLKGLLMWRITCLSESAQAIAHVGAVMGRNFTIDQLKVVARVSDDEVFGALESLALNQVLVQDHQGAYAFAQDQIQELLYANLDTAERSDLHTRVAVALEANQRERVAFFGMKFPGDAPLEKITAIAHHYMQGPRHDKTIRFALEAGRRSAALFANAEAEHFLAAGLALLKLQQEEAFGDDDPGAQAALAAFKRLRLDYLACLGDVRRVTGRNDAAKDAYVEAIPLAEELGERQALGRMLTWLGRCHQVLGAFPEATQCCQRALEIGLGTDDEAGATRCLIQLARIQYFMGELGQAIAYAEQALDLARKQDNTGQIGEALSILGYFYVASDPDKVEEGIKHLNDAMACLSVLGDWIALNTTYNFLGTAQNMLGNHLDAWNSFLQNRRICYEIGAKDELVFALLNLAITAFERGEFREMARMAKEARRVAVQLNSRFPQGMAVTLDATASAFMGNFASARSQIAEALELAQTLNHKYMETQVRVYQVQILLYLGDLPDARAAGEALAALIHETGDREPEGRLNVLMAEILGRQGDLDSARAYVDRALIPAVAAHAKHIQVRVLTTMAWIALTAEDWGDARNLAREALMLSERVGSRYQSAVLNLMLGEIALATGQGQAVQHFEAAAAIAGAVGSNVLLAQAYFGEAAATSTKRGARMQAIKARALVEDLLRDLDDHDREAFFTHRERRRLLDGDFYAYGTPVQERGKTLPRLGLNQGLWKMI